MNVSSDRCTSRGRIPEWRVTDAMKNLDTGHFESTQGENLGSCGYSGVCVPFKSRRHIKLSKSGNTSTRVEINAKEGSQAIIGKPLSSLMMLVWESRLVQELPSTEVRAATWAGKDSGEQSPLDNRCFAVCAHEFYGKPRCFAVPAVRKTSWMRNRDSTHWLFLLSSLVTTYC